MAGERDAPCHSSGDCDVVVSGLLVELQDVVPVDQVVDEGFQVFRPRIAVIDVIGMFPHVDAEDRGGTVDQRILAVGRLRYGELLSRA